MRVSRRSSIIIGLFVGVLCCAPTVVYGQEVSGVYRFFGLPTESISLLILRILQILLGVLALLTLGVAGYGGYLMRGGDADPMTASNGKTILKYSAIAGIIIAVLFAVITVVLGRMTANTAQIVEQSTGVAATPLVSSFRADRLSAFTAVSAHYPARDEKNIARNAVIVITFAKPIDPASLQNESKALLLDRVSIRRSASTSDQKTLVAASVNMSADNKIVAITPAQLLGDANQKVGYQVTLSANIKYANGDSIFGGTGAYSWNFETNGAVDTTPPQVESVFPAASSTVRVARNAMIQVTFTEAVDASVMTSKWLSVVDSAGAVVDGVIGIGNDYRTITFTPRAICEKNACGQSIGCFTANKTYRVTLTAASVASSAGGAVNRAKTPYDGITDVVGNAFDGGGASGVKKNGKAEGAPTDNYTWSFSTGADLYKLQPRISEVKPGRDAVGVDASTPVVVTFPHIMDLTSLHNSSIILSQTLNYWQQPRIDYVAGKTTVTIQHSPFEAKTRYTPEVRSGVRDIYQNCFAACNGPLQ